MAVKPAYTRTSIQSGSVMGARVAASLVAGNMKYTAVNGGPDGDDVSVVQVVSGNNTTLNVSVSESVVTINSATDGSGTATTTASDAATAINTDDDASSLIIADPAGDPDALIEAVSSTALSGGTDWVVGQS